MPRLRSTQHGCHQLHCSLANTAHRKSAEQAACLHMVVLSPGVWFGVRFRTQVKSMVMVKVMAKGGDGVPLMQCNLHF